MCDLIPTPRVSTSISKSKLWHLPARFHCPIIGTCLMPTEIRQLAAKLGDKEIAREGDYWLHTYMVSHCSNKNRIALALQKHLDKKYAAAIKRFSKAKSDDAVMALWKEHLQQGKVAEAFWAALCHPHSSYQLQEHLYEEVHMLSHQIGAGQRADLKRLADSQDEVKLLTKRLEEQEKKHLKSAANKEQQIHQLQQQLEQLQADNATLKRENHSLRHAGNQQPKQALIVEGSDWRQQYKLSERRVEKLTAQLQQQSEQMTALEQLMMPRSDSCEGCDNQDCHKNPDFNGRKVLCVGGQHKMTGSYKELVNRCNGEFSHHDGGKEDSRKRLESMLNAADVIVCATDCVSHDAYYRLKRFCKANDKPYLFLPNSGLSSFAMAINSMAEKVAANPNSGQEIKIVNAG
ncbi:DUF2325 domain-containing protein [Ferrimonas aestuarii]|uniref:DUF2325 domain-containing protein n=1 Tax=Ferrimonas aestuarii TaxID=2569539 RepID=A0A4U1BT41_9GAMM|nr:DUF2325 domain-containing protein [Ferrimonas aestuarii]TKB58616.1 DUF2325 domain-containing protein [Ferrimonas aestuarii]